MFTTHIIIDNIVANTIVATVSEAQAAFPDAICLDADQYGGGIGWHWDGTALHAPEQPAPAPTSCTPAQGLVALYAQKGITEDQLLQAIENIPDAVQQYTARIGLQRATTWERDSPTMQAMAALLGLTEQDLDDLYTLTVTVVV